MHSTLSLLVLCAVPLLTMSFVARPTFPARARALHESADTEISIADADAYEVRENPRKLVFKPRNYFYGRCSVELGIGYKTMTEQFSPSWKDDLCSLACVEVPMPLGMVIEESGTMKGRIEVVDIVEGSNAEVSGIRVGDVLRAVTAQKKDAMAAAEGNIAFNALAGATTSGVEVKRALYIADGRSFDFAMEALLSNSVDNGGPGEVALVLERRNEGV